MNIPTKWILWKKILKQNVEKRLDNRAESWYNSINEREVREMINEVMLDKFIGIKAGRSVNTAEAYRKAIEQFGEYLGKGFETATKQDFVDYATFLSTKYAPNTVRARLSSIASWYKYLMFCDEIAAIPFDYAQFKQAGLIPEQVMPKKEALVKTDTRDDISLLLAGCDTIRDRAIIMVMIDTGVRASELCDLKFAGWKGNSIRVDIAKRNEIRVVAISDATREMLELYVKCERRDSAYLFTSNNTVDGRMDRCSLSHKITSIAKKVNIDFDVSAHTLRRTCATYEAQQGVPLTMIQHQLGHASISMTAYYAKDVEKSRNETTARVMQSAWSNDTKA